MTIRSASLLAAALTGMAMPALAQDGYDPNVPPPLPELEGGGTWQGKWQGGWESSDTYRGIWHGTYTGLDGAPVEAEYRGTFIGDTRFVSEDGHRLYRDGNNGWREAEGYAPGAGVGYRAGPYDAWLAECRTAYYDAGGRQRGAVIGGALGAVAGGIAGNEISDGDTEAALIGAGVGAVTGAAIGSAIGEDAGRDRLDECEIALQHYRPGYGQHHGYGAYGYGYPPVMWVRVPIQSGHRHGRGCGCEQVVEQWVEEEVVAPAPVGQVKIQRVAPARTKNVRTVK